MEITAAETVQTLWVHTLSKKFCADLRLNIVYGLSDIMRSSIGIKPSTHLLRAHEFWAVHNMTFSLNKGDVLGIIGPNGCGKTTLLRLIASVLAPDTGEISLRGKVVSLLTVGGGFHPTLTVRENIFCTGAILGLSYNFVSEQLERIVQFAELYRFIDAPVSALSPGMHARLSIALALVTGPDILLIDEILSVTDQKFRDKCIRKIRSLSHTSSVILVSHNMDIIKSTCSRVLVMLQGEKAHESRDVRESIEYYFSLKNDTE